MKKYISFLSRKSLFIVLTGIFLLPGHSTAQIWSSFSCGEDVIQMIKQDNDLWVLTSDAGLFKVNMQTRGLTRYTPRNSGFPNSTINAFAMDPGGHLWFATYDTGLVKFDGTAWTVYSTENSDIYTNYLDYVVADKNGNIWIESSTRLMKFDGITWTGYDHSYRNIYSMAIEYKNDSTIIWSGTSSGSVIRFNGVSFSDISNQTSYLGDWSIEALALDATNKLWIGTSYDGIILKDGDTFTHYTEDNSNLANDRVNSFRIDNSNHVWCATGYDNVSVFEGDFFRVINDTYNVEDIEFDDEGNIWLGYGDDGLAIYDPVTYSQTSILLSNSIPGNTINAIASDDGGNKWIGTDNGIAVYDGSWQIYDTSNTLLGSNEIEDIVKDNSNNMWIGTDDRGLAKFDGVNWTIYNMSNSDLPSNYIEALDVDNAGNIWIGTSSDGLAKYSNGTFTEYNTINSDLPYDQIYDVRHINNSIYACTRNGLGILNLASGNWTIYNTSNSGLPDDDVSAVAQDKEGRLWIGTYGGGVVRVVGDTWINFNATNSGLVDDYVYDIIVNNAGEIWIATSWGLSKPNIEYWTWDNFSQYNSELLDNSLNCLFYDESESSLWIGTDAGVSIYGSKAYAGIHEDEPMEPLDINVYPNPVHNILHVKTTSNIRQVIVSNTMGSQIMQKSFSETRNMNQFKEYQLNMSNLEPGVYIISLIDENLQMISEKILKE